MPKTVLIKNGILITLGDNGRVLYDHALLIEDGIIKKIGPQSQFKGRYSKIIDAAGQVVMPGFINAHMHFYSTLVRGLSKAQPAQNFVQVLENLWWRLDKALSLEDCYYSTLIILLNAIRHGTTTLIDHHASPHAVRGSLPTLARAVKAAGVRACLCYEVSDRDGETIAQEGLAENVDFIRSCREKPDAQLTALFGLHAAFTLSDKTLDAAARLGHELQIGFHIHVAEADADEAASRQQHQLRVVERLARHGILGSQTIAAHCVHVDSREMELLAQTGTMVVHNPQSNLNNAVGIADILELHRHKILVGLGTDAMTVAMLEELRVALWAQHLKQNNPSCAFLEATGTLLTNNAKIARRIWNLPLGELCEGGAGDVICVDYFPPTPLTEETVLGHLIFGISQAVVDTTIVAGNILMHNKRLTIDIAEEEVAAKARELTVQLWNRFGDR